MTKIHLFGYSVIRMGKPGKVFSVCGQPLVQGKNNGFYSVKKDRRCKKCEKIMKDRMAALS